MKEKINIAELLEDCPKGMELYSPIFGKLKFNEVNAINNRILVVQQNDCIAEFESDGRLINCKNGECLLFPSKGKTTWEGFVPPYKFMDGDILFVKATYSWIIIYKESIYDVDLYKYVGISDLPDYPPNTFMVYDCNPVCCKKAVSEIRLATEEEKQKLFDAIKANGYKWNPETKTLEKLVEPKFKVGDEIKYKNGKNIDGVEQGVILSITDEVYDVAVTNNMGVYVSIAEQDDWELVPSKFDINTLKPFDKVLVRDNNEQFWTCDWFSFHDTKQVYPFACVGHYVSQCIPYEGNQHLLGTTDDCNEYFKNW